MTWLVAVVPLIRRKEFVREARPFCTRIYVPVILLKKELRQNRGVVKIKKPAFGSYMFVKIRSGKRRSVAECKGFKSWVMMGEEIVIMQARSIKRVKEWEKNNFGYDMLKPVNLAIGKVVKINSEMNGGVIGVIVDMPEKKDIVLEINGMRVSVDIDRISAV